MLPAVHDAWKEMAEGHDDYATILRMLGALEEVQSILRDFSNDLFIPLGQSDRLAILIDDFLIRYQRLSYASEEAGRFLWNNPSKFHWLWHWSRKARFVNPRRTNCCIDEDFVGKVKKLVHSCSAGADTQRMVVKTMNKYRWAMHFMSFDRTED